MALLKNLGIDVKDLEPSAAGGAFRIEFEGNFILEVEPLNEQSFRASTRICVLGKSLTVQASQIEKALDLQAEVMPLTNTLETLSISPADNCLRLLTDIKKGNGNKLTDREIDEMLSQFEEFANNAYAFRKTYFLA